MNELLTKGIGHTEFKDSPVGKIPVGWEVKEFGEVTLLVKSGLSRRISLQDIGLPVINSGNIQNNILDVNELKYWYLDDPQGANTEDYILDDGDILLNFINSMSQIGKTCIFKNIGRPSIYTTNVFRIKVALNYDSVFIHQVMVSDKFQTEIQLISKPAVNQASFTKQDLIKVQIPLPPLPEQQKIASILTSVDEVIEKTQSQINKLQDLKKGTMNELLTKGIGHTEFKDSPVGKIPVEWEIMKIGNLGKVVTGNTPKTSETDNYGGNIPFISPVDIDDSMYVRETKSTLTEKGLSQTRVLGIETVLVVCIGSTIGKVGITTRISSSNQQINSIVCDTNNSAFVYFLMKFNSGKIKSLAGTQAIPIINKTEFSSILVPLPPLPEQQKIASILSSMDSYIEEKQRKLQQTQSLKKSLMQDLLTGKVRVTVN